MPRRRPAQLRADSAARLRTKLIGSFIAETSNFTGLSPYGRVVLARLENSRLGPGAVAEALARWERFVRRPYRPDYDPLVEGCGLWGCCTALTEVQWVLEMLIIAERNLPKRDARRLRVRLGRLDDYW